MKVQFEVVAGIILLIVALVVIFGVIVASKHGIEKTNVDCPTEQIGQNFIDKVTGTPPTQTDCQKPKIDKPTS